MRLNRDLDIIKERKTEADIDITESIQAIINDVRETRDSAVRRYAEKYDKYTGSEFLVSQEEMDAFDVDTDLMRVLQRAMFQITEFHRNQIEKSWSMFRENGVILGQIARPLERVALYVPAALASSLLMCAIPAMLANVKDIVVLTPVKANGKVSDVVLVAASLCGIKTIYKVGGAHAIAAAAYGTKAIPKVDKIVGPGSKYVATAKRLVYGEVDIDLIAGPSDILIVADETANPKYVAADLLSQAEHDENSSSILVTTSEKLIVDTETEIERQLSHLNHAEKARKALFRFGAAIYVQSIEEAFEKANDMAPEHLEILTIDPMSYLPMVKNAGSIFLGESTPEPLGDYMSGTNHVLPTGGRAKFFSGLGVYSFMKYSAYSYYPRAALEELSGDVVKFALSEGLDAHANSVKVRFEGSGTS